jgi:signal transduction histidine kinase
MLVSDFLFTQKVQNERSTARQFADVITKSFGERDTDAIYAILTPFSSMLKIRFMIVDNEAVVQVDTDGTQNGTLLNPITVMDVLNGLESSYDFYPAPNELMTDKSAVCMYVEAITYEGERSGAMVVLTAAQNLYDSLWQIRRDTITWAVLIAIAVLILSLFVSNMFTKPISALGAGIERMSRSDFSYKVQIKGRNEFAQLATAFNMMCSRLEQLDRSREQFISNASHELKTPLSTMKILIETLLYQDGGFEPAVQNELLTDINKEVDRLNAIISDLLALAYVDSGEADIKYEPILLNELLIDSMERLYPLARDRRIELNVSAREQVTALCDRNRIAQVMYNLIDNAIKYTSRGGYVRAELTRAGKRAVLRVMDTGIGISKDDLIHMFDRFYRVDRARSRETGGTGLGLSIVKQIVSLHRGDISVTSEEGKGSTFTVELPL